MALRIDALGAFAGPRRLPGGGLEVDARLTKTGVFVYRFADGSSRRELRHPEDVLHPDSIATLKHAAVTVLHPPERKVDASNWKSRAVGHMGDVRASGNYLDGTLVVQDGATVDRLDRKELAEISLGYRVDYDNTPGTYEGQAYDVRQRNIRYNHVAMGPVNWGRVGRDCALKLDSYIDSMELDTAVCDDAGQAPPPVPPTVLDAKDFVSRTEFETVRAERDALKTQVAQLTAKCDSAEAAVNPAALDKLVAERTKLVAEAKILAPALKVDGLDALSIMRSALKVADPSLTLDSESSDYVRASFGFHVKSRASVMTSHARVQSVTAPPGDAVTDASDEDPILKAHRANVAAYGKKSA